MKLGKRDCDIRMVRQTETDYAVYLLGRTFGSIILPTWELVALWYKIGDLLGIDQEDARIELERRHWRHDDGILDEQDRFIDPKRKNKKGFKRGSTKN